jgi:hypothetical protein
MSNLLPPIGTNRLLESVCDYVPDDFTVSRCARDFTGGRRHALSALQLWLPTSHPSVPLISWVMRITKSSPSLVNRNFR